MQPFSGFSSFYLVRKAEPGLEGSVGGHSTLYMGAQEQCDLQTRDP